MAPNRIRELVRAAEASRPGIDAVAHLCSMAAEGLPVDGVGLSVTGGPGRHSKVTATDEVSGHIEDLQVLLGQGPCVDAVATGAPVLVPDLEAPGVQARWPAFLPAVSAVGVRASFALPLVVGEVRLGAMDLYRSEVGGARPAGRGRGQGLRGRCRRAAPRGCAHGAAGPAARRDAQRVGRVQRGAPGVRHGHGPARLRHRCGVRRAAGPGLPRGTTAGGPGPGRHRTAGPLRPVSPVTDGGRTRLSWPCARGSQGAAGRCRVRRPG